MRSLLRKVDLQLPHLSMVTSTTSAEALGLLIPVYTTHVTDRSRVSEGEYTKVRSPASKPANYLYIRSHNTRKPKIINELSPTSDYNFNGEEEVVAETCPRYIAAPVMGW